jgi:hypothetical protein
MRNIEPKNRLAEDVKFFTTVLEWIEAYNKDSSYVLEIDSCALYKKYEIQVVLKGRACTLGFIQQDDHKVEVFAPLDILDVANAFVDARSPDMFSKAVTQRIEFNISRDVTK